MNIEYTELLEYDTIDKMYTLTITTFSGDYSVTRLNFLLVENKHNCRLDKICTDLYGDAKWVGQLCSLNNIYNPFSVKQGDILVYLPASDMANMSKVPDTIKYGTGAVAKTKSDLINAFKNKKTDITRGNFLEKQNKTDNLPPSIAISDMPAIIMDGNKIIITSPTPITSKNQNTEAVDADTTADLGAVTDQNDTIERVLVNKYIKYLNQ